VCADVWNLPIDQMNPGDVEVTNRNGPKLGSDVKTIALLAVVAIVLLDVFGSKSSVGGPMADLMVSFLIMQAGGVYETRESDPAGWVVNVVLAFIGGLAGLWLTTMTWKRR